VVEEEEVGGNGRTFKRKSMAKGSVDNVMTVLGQFLHRDLREFDIHVNFPGGVPVDGPSAGVTIATAIYSAITGKPIDNRLAMTGEVSIRGLVKPVGGVPSKIEAARHAGCTRVIVPRESWQDSFRQIQGINVIPVERLQQVFDHAFQFVVEAPPVVLTKAVELDVEFDVEDPVVVPWEGLLELPGLPQPAATVSKV